MDGAKSYKTAGALRAALETRLQARAREQGTDLQRLRRQVAFDRFLARMFSKGPKATYPWVLKGGYDEMTDRAFADYAGGTPEERARRALLRQAIEKQHFKVNPKESSGGTSTIGIGNSTQS